MTYDFDGPEATELQIRRAEAQRIATPRWYLAAAGPRGAGLVFIKTAHPHRDPGGPDNPIPLAGPKVVAELMRTFRAVHMPFGIRIEGVL